MIADKKFIEHLRKICHMNIPDDLEAYLLEEYSEEPFPYEYSEQDLYEQIRKLVMKYHNGQLDVTLRGPEQLLKQRYEELKDEYLEVWFKIGSLEREIDRLRSMLLEYNVDSTKLYPDAAECDEHSLMF